MGGRAYNITTMLFGTLFLFAFTMTLVNIAKELHQPGGHWQALAQVPLKLAGYAFLLVMIQFAAGQFGGKGSFFGSGDPAVVQAGNFGSGLAGAVTQGSSLQTGPISATGGGSSAAGLHAIAGPGDALDIGGCEAWKVVAAPFFIAHANMASSLQGMPSALVNLMTGISIASNVIAFVIPLILDIIAALALLFAYGYLAVQMFLMQAGAILIAIVGMPFLAFSATPWTKKYSDGYWGLVANNAIGMFSVAITGALIDKLVSSSIQTYVSEATKVGPNDLAVPLIIQGVAMIGVALLSIGLIVMVPKMAHSLITGQHPFGMSDLGSTIGRFTAVVGTAAAGAGLAAIGLGKLAQSANGAMKAIEGGKGLPENALGGSFASANQLLPIASNEIGNRQPVPRSAPGGGIAGHAQSATPDKQNAGLPQGNTEQPAAPKTEESTTQETAGAAPSAESTQSDAAGTASEERIQQAGASQDAASADSTPAAESMLQGAASDLALHATTGETAQIAESLQRTADTASTLAQSAPAGSSRQHTLSAVAESAKSLQSTLSAASAPDAPANAMTSARSAAASLGRLAANTSASAPVLASQMAKTGVALRDAQQANPKLAGSAPARSQANKAFAAMSSASQAIATSMPSTSSARGIAARSVTQMSAGLVQATAASQALPGASADRSFARAADSLMDTAQAVDSAPVGRVAESLGASSLAMDGVLESNVYRGDTDTTKSVGVGQHLAHEAVETYDHELRTGSNASEIERLQGLGDRSWQQQQPSLESATAPSKGASPVDSHGAAIIEHLATISEALSSKASDGAPQQGKPFQQRRPNARALYKEHRQNILDAIKNAGDMRHSAGGPDHGNHPHHERVL